jgi:DNA-binding transcriptional regulator YiaG
MAHVTSENFAERLLRSAEQAVAFKAGEQDAGHVVRRKLTSRKVLVDEAPQFKPERIIGLRERLGVSQPVFADVVGVKPVTVKAWEQGQKVPSGAARRLLQVLEAQPSAVMKAARVKSVGEVAVSGAVARTSRKKQISKRSAA